MDCCADVVRCAYVTGVERAHAQVQPNAYRRTLQTRGTQQYGILRTRTNWSGPLAITWLQTTPCVEYPT